MGIKILLICGSGASTGFLVQNMRVVAKKRQIDATIEARSDSQLKSMADKVDVVLAGPHLKYQSNKIKAICEAVDTPFDFLDHVVYGALDGEKALDMALSMNKK